MKMVSKRAARVGIVVFLSWCSVMYFIYHSSLYEYILRWYRPPLPLKKQMNMSEAMFYERDSPYKRPRVLNRYEVTTNYTSAFWTGGCGEEDENSPPPKPCQEPRSRLVFIKTHKCGTTTLLSPLLRYAERHSLNIPLSRFHPHFLGWPKPYRPYYVKFYRALKPFDMLLHHMIYDRCYVRRDFPRSTTTYITILREPWRQFVSSIEYFKYPEFKSLNNSIRTILSKPSVYGRPLPMHIPPNPYAKLSPVVNPMAQDLGFHNKFRENQTAIENFIRQLEKDLDLVLLVEYFDESLILLKRLMCWQFRDIFYIRKNVQQDPGSGKRTADEEMKSRHRIIDSVDYALFDFFNQTLQRKMKEQGSTFQREVNIFKKTNWKVNEFCRGKQKRRFVLTANEFMSEETITRDDCKELQSSPGKLTNMYGKELDRSRRPFKVLKLKLAKHKNATTTKR